MVLGIDPVASHISSAPPLIVKETVLLIPSRYKDIIISGKNENRRKKITSVL